MGLHRIPEEYHDIDFAVGYHRPKLLIASEGSGFELDYFIFQGMFFIDLLRKGFLDKFSGCARTYKPVIEKLECIPVHPFD
jgi:hypothetical protein